VLRASRNLDTSFRSVGPANRSTAEHQVSSRLDPLVIRFFTPRSPRHSVPSVCFRSLFRRCIFLGCFLLGNASSPFSIFILSISCLVLHGLFVLSDSLRLSRCSAGFGSCSSNLGSASQRVHPELSNFYVIPCGSIWFDCCSEKLV
jgi:hypothetical protein